jgi:hypothetical protein
MNCELQDIAPFSNLLALKTEQRPDYYNRTIFFVRRIGSCRFRHPKRSFRNARNSAYVSIYTGPTAFMPLFLRQIVFLAVLLPSALLADDVVFKSDVALSRVDAQVMDRSGRNVTGLQKEDFVLRVDGKPVPIRGFASEEMPIDIVLLLDVSGSMQPHVRRIASASEQALNVLAPNDRIAVMVFDTHARVRLPFRSDHDEITKSLQKLLHSEHFNGGTRITDAIMSAADYLRSNARPEARRAVVILTDDQTQDEEDEPRVEGALAESNAVLSFIQAPYEEPSFSRPRRGTWGGGGGGIGFPGGGWPGGGGGGWPGSGGGGPMGGGGSPGGYGMGNRSHTAGTATIAQDSGGDTMSVNNASALEDTLERLRQRYALSFYMPEGMAGASRDSVRVDLASEARARFSDADVQYRRVFMSGGTGVRSGPTQVSHAPPDADSVPPAPTPAISDSSSSGDSTEPSTTHRRRGAAVNESSSGPVINTVPSN